jgi:hypothetical protein
MKDEAEVGKTVTNYDKRPGEAQGFFVSRLVSMSWQKSAQVSLDMRWWNARGIVPES